MVYEMVYQLIGFLMECNDPLILEIFIIGPTRRNI